MTITLSGLLALPRLAVAREIFGSDQVWPTWPQPVSPLPLRQASFGVAGLRTFSEDMKSPPRRIVRYRFTLSPAVAWVLSPITPQFAVAEVQVVVGGV